MLSSTKIYVIPEFAIFNFSLNIAAPLPFIIILSSFDTSSAPSKAQSGLFSKILTVGIFNSWHNALISKEVGIAVIFKFSSSILFASSFIAKYEVEPEPKPITSPSLAFSAISFATFSFCSLLLILFGSISVNPLVIHSII